MDKDLYRLYYEHYRDVTFISIGGLFVCLSILLNLLGFPDYTKEINTLTIIFIGFSLIFLILVFVEGFRAYGLFYQVREAYSQESNGLKTIKSIEKKFWRGGMDWLKRKNQENVKRKD